MEYIIFVTALVRRVQFPVDNKKRKHKTDFERGEILAHS